MKKGKLIVFEGSDGSGKATQAKLLYKYFKKNKIPTELISFPDYTSNWGKLIKKYLSGEFGDVNEVDPYLASALYAGDRLLASEKIKRWLKTGRVVVCDRYADTNVAHQAAKIKDRNVKAKFMNWLEDFEYKKNNIPSEDLVIFLAVPVSNSQKLMKSRKKDIHERDKQYLTKVSEIFEDLAKRKNYWKKINCVEKSKLLSKEKIHEKVLGLI